MERLTDQIVSFSQELTFADLPPGVVARAKDLILDAVGCGLGAVSSPPGLIAQAMAATVSSTTPATVIGTGQRTSPDLAAFANGVMIRYLDYNPSDLISAALASTEAAGGDGRSAIVGTVLAFEVLYALADTRHHGYDAESGWARWDPATRTAVASAAVAARQLGLSREQAGHAVSMATVSHLTLGKVRRGQLSHWKGSATANASRNAVFCALLAARGMTGPSPVFEGPNGFFEAVGTEIDFQPTPGGTHRIMDAHVKAVPAGFYGQGAAEAAAELRPKIPGLDAVKEVRVLTSPHGAQAMGNDVSRWRPETRETADHSLPFVVAMTFMEGRLEVRHFDEERYKRPDVREFMAKVQVIASDELADGPLRLSFTEVAVETESGDVHTARVARPLGHPERPLTDEDYERKFRSLAQAVLPEERIVRLIERLRDLEHAEEVGSVIELSAR